MRAPVRTATALLVIALLALVAPARATLYSFVDENGVTHYTNVPSDARFRKVPGSPPPRDALASDSVRRRSTKPRSRGSPTTTGWTARW
jgi:hypothetical protein